MIDLKGADMNQIFDNPFEYSDTNKRYHTFSYASKKRYGSKIAKIPLNAGFTCPNRDGTKSTGGCAFCSAMGSGDTILESSSSLAVQYETNLERARHKWPDCQGIAYFQSFSNTYAPLDTLKRIYTPFFENKNVSAIAIATRTDCFSKECAKWLGEMQKKYRKDVWVEFGLQSRHEKTAKAMNFAHTAQDAKNAISLCREYGLLSCLHIINGLPDETREMMIATARYVNELHPDAIKIHMLHLLKNTRLGEAWLKENFELLSLDEYVSIVCDQLEVLSPDIIIERVTGDGLADDLLAPLWTAKKTMTANAIDTELFKRNSWQGRLSK